MHGRTNMVEEKAETGRLQPLLSRVGESLDQYLKFEYPDALAARERWQTALDRPVPQQGIGIDAVVDEILTYLVPYGPPVPKPGFTGYIVTGGTTAAAVASTAAYIASPVRYLPTAFNFVEELSLDWLAQMFGLGAMKGIYSSGGSVANLIALGAARQAAFEKIGRDPARDGVDRPVAVYASRECHHTIQRSCGVLGVGRHAVRAVDCDISGRLRVDALAAAVEADLGAGILPMAIVANAGTTNTGAIARQHGIWLHVDGAYGLPGILDSRVSDRYRGIEMADSVIVDPHKWLGAAAGIAATFVHDRSLLQRAFTQEPADYLEGTIQQADAPEPRVEHTMDDFGIPYYDYGVELTAPCRGIAVWAMLREIGVDGIRARIERHNDMAREVADFCRQHDNLELLLEPTLSICCFRYIAPGVDDLDLLNQRLHRRLIHENEHLPSTTRVNGQLALRPCFLGARTGRDEVEGMLQSILRIGAALTAENG